MLCGNSEVCVTVIELVGYCEQMNVAEFLTAGLFRKSLLKRMQEIMKTTYELMITLQYNQSTSDN